MAKFVRIFVLSLSVLFPASLFSYNILIDVSKLPPDQIPECAQFLSDTADCGYSIIIPEKARPWVKKMIYALDRRSEFEVAAALEPEVWLRGAENLGTSDADDVFAKSLKRYRDLTGGNIENLFIGPQMPSAGSLNVFAQNGVKKIYTVGAGGIYRDPSSGIYVISCAASDHTSGFEEIPVYVRPSSFENLRKLFAQNPPAFPETGPGVAALPSGGGIVLSGLQLKLWDFFSSARKDLENYKNSGRADNATLLSALAGVYELEKVTNWTDEINAQKVLYGIADIYRAIGMPLPAAYTDISNVLFGEMKELPVSVSENGLLYTVGGKDGYFTVDGTFAAAVSTDSPVEFYWWNPASAYSVKKDVYGEDTDSPVNYCLYLADKCYFYSASGAGWQRLWSVFSVGRSSSGFSIKFPLAYMQLDRKTNISFFIKIASRTTRALSVSLPDSAAQKKWLDAVGDANGPGWYKLPDGAPAGIADIMSLSIWHNSKRTLFRFYFAGPLAGDGFRAGFDLYADINGIRRKGIGECSPGLNSYLEEDAYWEYRLSVTSSSAVLTDTSGGSVNCELKTDSSLRIAAVSVKNGVFPYDPAKCKFTFCSYMVDDSGAVLPVQEEKTDLLPGGGNPSKKSPNVLDIIAPSKLRQKQILSVYLKRRGVIIPALP